MTFSFPTITTALHGHTKENPYLVPDYPYGFRLRCQLRAWLEVSPQHGTRFVTQTSNPKKPGLVWNKPKASTYALIAGGMYLDDVGHIAWYGLGQWSGHAECAAFLEHWPELGRELAPWVLAQIVYNERNASEDLAAWKAIATALKASGAMKPGVRETLAAAYAAHDLPAARAIVDRLRTKGLGPTKPFDYEDLFALAGRAVPGIERATWDAFLREIDDTDAVVETRESVLAAMPSVE